MNKNKAHGHSFINANHAFLSALTSTSKSSQSLQLHCLLIYFVSVIFLLIFFPLNPILPNTNIILAIVHYLCFKFRLVNIYLVFFLSLFSGIYCWGEVSLTAMPLSIICIFFLVISMDFFLFLIFCVFALISSHRFILVYLYKHLVGTFNLRTLIFTSGKLLAIRPLSLATMYLNFCHSQVTLQHYPPVH